MIHNTLQDLTETERYRVLSDELRRIVVDLLDRTPGSFESTLGELASDIDRATPYPASEAAWSRHELLVQLHHVHLPLLDELDLLEYNPETNQLRRITGQTPSVSPNR